jgi:hypothetical protein
MKSLISLIAAAHAAVALASFFAVRGMSRTIHELEQVGGGIATVSEGVVSSARWPLIAAWIAVVASVLALLLARRNEPQERPVRSAVLAAIAIGAGIAAVFAFREVPALIAYAIIPPGGPASAIREGLTSASWITALCFAAAIGAAVMALRTRAAMHVAVLAVVVSLGVSATMIVTLRDLSGIYADVLKGDTERLRALRAELR